MVYKQKISENSSLIDKMLLSKKVIIQSDIIQKEFDNIKVHALKEISKGISTEQQKSVDSDLMALAYIISIYKVYHGLI